MKSKLVVRRKAVDHDIQAALEYYYEEGAESAALRFLDLLEQAIIQIGRQPKAGSPRYGHELNIPGLRFKTLPRFPHLVFYVEKERHIEIWRILHGQRDIPGWLMELNNH